MGVTTPDAGKCGKSATVGWECRITYSVREVRGSIPRPDKGINIFLERVKIPRGRENGD